MPAPSNTLVRLAGQSALQSFAGVTFAAAGLSGKKRPSHSRTQNVVAGSAGGICAGFAAGEGEKRRTAFGSA